MNLNYFIKCTTLQDSPVFKSVAMCTYFVDRIRTVYRGRVLAYCVLPTKYALLVDCNAENIERTVRVLNTSVSLYYGAMFKKHGPFFDQSPIVTKVESTKELLSASRYIHLLPISGDVVNDIDTISAYPWSSYYEYTHKNNTNICLSEKILAKLSKQEYEYFIQTGQGLEFL